jgi:hypothetical protein
VGNGRLPALPVPDPVDRCRKLVQSGEFRAWGLSRGDSRKLVDWDVTELSIAAKDADDVRALLEDAFGAAFEVWRWSAKWQQVSGPAPGDAPPPPVQRWLDQLRSGPAEPRIENRGDDGWLLLIPFALERDTLYATCQTATDSAHVWLRLAREMLARHVEDTAFELHRDLDECAAQLTHNLEELVFLRCIAAHLEFRGPSLGVSSLSELVLPQLREAVSAETVGLVVEENDACRPRIIWSGRRVMADEACLELVQRHRQRARQQSLVVNLEPDMDGDPHEGSLRNFILVPMACTDQLQGWLIALNRDQSDDGSADSPWRLSHHEFGSDEATLLESAASVIASHATTAELFREKEKLLVNVVRAIVSAVETRDAYTCGHSERVALFGQRLSRELGYAENDCERIHLTSLLHDVGKIGISDAALKKSGRLTEQEFEEIKRHPDLAWAILHDLEQLVDLFPGIVHHHERYDGGGYPDGLAGDDIPLDARIVAVADAYDAMTSNRPYRQGLSQEKTESILREGRGRQWDPNVVDAFLRIMPDVQKLRNNHRRPDPSRRPARQPASAP